MADEFEDILKLLDEVSYDWEAEWEKKRNKRKNPYALHLIKVLYNHPHGKRLPDVYDQIERMRRELNLPIPKDFEATVRSAFNSHSTTSDTFHGLPEEGLFYSVGKKGSGRWGLHQEVADAWVRRRHLELINNESAPATDAWDRSVGHGG